MPRWIKRSLLCLLVIIALLLLSMLIVPWQIKKQGPAWIAANTERQLSIEKVFFNPLTLTVNLTGMVLTEQNSTDSFVSFDRLKLSASLRSIIDRAVILDRIVLENPYLNIELLGKQHFNFSDFIPEQAAEPRPEQDPGKPLLFSFNNIIISGGKIDFTDQTSEQKSQHKIRELDLAVPFIGNVPYLTDSYVEPQLDMLLNGSEISATGQLKPFHQSLETSLSLVLNEVDLAFYAFHSPVPLPVEVKSGILDTEIDLSYRVSDSRQPQLLLSSMLALSDIDIRTLDQQELLKLPTLILDLAQSDLLQPALNLTSLDIYQPEIHIDRDSRGVFTFQQLLPEGDQSGPDSEPLPAKEKKPLQLNASAVHLHDGRLHYSDAGLTDRPQFSITELAIGLTGICWPERCQSPLTIAAKLGSKGSFSLSGSLAHSPLQLEAATDLQSLALADFNGFLPEKLNLDIKDGKLFSKLQLKLEQQPDSLSGNFSGNMNLGDFNLADPLGEGELLSWESLNLEGINGEVTPFKLDIAEIALSNYQAKIRVDPTGRVNLASINPAEESKQPAQSAKTEQEESTAAEQTTATAPPAELSIDALTLQGGTVSFVDQSLPDRFSTTMYKLGGRVTGMNSDPAMRADVDLRGELENHSPLTISGTLNPLSRDLFADLNVSFQDIDLTPLTPYSGTYLGYKIDKGKLYLDLNYHIEERKINAGNKVLIDQFSLGDTVESDKATTLPIGLAIALLQDSKGEIHLDIPVAGDMDDPEFTVVGVIFTVLKNLIVKAATSPFALLGSMIGSGDQDYSSVGFAPGLADLDAQQTEKLNKLAEILAQRPGLTLQISAYVDPENDPEAYRHAQLQQRLVTEKLQQLKEQQTPPATAEEIIVDAEERPELILALYQQADFPRPQNALGRLKSLPVEEMEKLLLANILAGEEQMTELAKIRALTVRDALVSADDSIKPRLFLSQGEIYQPLEEGQGPASRAEFSISAK